MGRRAKRHLWKLKTKKWNKRNAKSSELISKDSICQEDEFKRLGSKGEYNDYAAEVIYEWDGNPNPHIKSTSDYRIIRMKTLKDLCAMRIAENHHLLNLELVSFGSWSIWNRVWEYICIMRRDTFQLFQIFASFFHEENGFYAHGQHPQAYPDQMRKVIIANRLPGSRNHRIEKLFRNVKISHLIGVLNNMKFQNIVVLEIARELVSEELVSLTYLSNLGALKLVSEKPLEDSLINSWCIGLKADKWQKLQVLSLPQISEKSISKLQRQIKWSKLMYIETHYNTISFDMQSSRNIDKENWKILHNEGLTTLSLAIKLFTLMSKYALVNHTLKLPSSTITLDFNIVDLEYSNKQNTEKSLATFDRMWSVGEARGNYWGLLLTDYKGALTKCEALNESLQGNLQKSTFSKREVVRSKPKVRNLSTFFDI